MHTGIPRRKFLKTAGFAALASAGVQFLEPTATQGESTNDDSSSSKMARLLSGCCAYSYHNELKKGTMTLEDFIRKAVMLRLDGVDMTAYYFKSTDPGYLADLRHLAYKNAVPFSGVACGVSMVQASPAAREAGLNEIKKWVDVTERLGASHLRVFAGTLPPGATTQQGVDWVVETMKAGSDYSGKKGIMLGLEDHEGVTQNADVCVEVMHRVNSEYAGINLDITNFIATPAQDPYQQIKACLPYATNVHVRDHFYDHTAVDMDRVWRLFAQSDFKGYMSAEYEGDEAGGASKLIAKIQKLCKKYSSA